MMTTLKQFTFVSKRNSRSLTMNSFHMLPVVDYFSNATINEVCLY